MSEQYDSSNRERDKLPRYRIDTATLAHDNHPKRNEDAYTASEDGYLGVFDGVGGHHGSEEASRFVAAFCNEALSDMPLDLDKDSARALLERTLRYASDALVMASDIEVWGHVSTTAVIARIFHDPESHRPYLATAHAGDSRAYIIRDGEVSTVTTDHGFTDAATQSEISKARFVHELPESHKYLVGTLNIITSSLSSRPEEQRLVISTTTSDLELGDIVLLTSDGIHDNLLDKEIATLVSSGNVSELVAQAQRESRRIDYGQHKINGKTTSWRSFRSKPDDMTAVALYMPE